MGMHDVRPDLAKIRSKAKLSQAKIAEIVVNTMPRNERHRNDLHKHPQYYAIRNHLVEFLVNRSKAFDQEIVAGGYTPVGRPGTADEVAAVVGFLASDEASYINAVCLPVDGGLTARSA